VNYPGHTQAAHALGPRFAATRNPFTMFTPLTTRLAHDERWSQSATTAVFPMLAWLRAIEFREAGACIMLQQQQQPYQATRQIQGWRHLHRQHRLQQQ
jgi:hypothetical protein